MEKADQTQDGFQLDERGRAILARHTDWWQRKGMLCVEVPSTPLGDLWLPLSGGALAT